VEAVGPPDEEANLGVESFDATVGDAVLDGVEDEVPASAHGLGHLDEGFQAGALGPGTPAIEEGGRLVPGQVTGQDGPELLLPLVGPPDATPVATDAGQLRGLGVGQILGVLEQCPPRPLEVASPALAGKTAEVVPQVATDLVE